MDAMDLADRTDAMDANGGGDSPESWQLGDPRDCAGTCRAWSAMAGECILPRAERTCGQREPQSRREGGRQDAWDLYADPRDDGADHKSRAFAAKLFGR